ncbi:MAG: tetratricopeptide repeat protein [Gemmatimonadetes bacterium]|nr:tetratricopeptide repeat protein [Gemmatimonadota bacterium]
MAFRRVERSLVGVLLALGGVWQPLPAQSNDARRTDPVARAALDSGIVLERRGQVPAAQQQFRIALAAARRAVDSTTMADAQLRLGVTWWSVNQSDSGLAYLAPAVAVRRRIGPAVELARALNSLGASYYQLGIYEPALELFLEATQLRRETNDSLGLSRSLTNVGKTYHDWRQYARADSIFDHAIAVAERVPSAAPALGYALNSKALLAIDRGAFAEAERLIEAAKAAYARPGARSTRGDTIDAWELNAAAEGALLLRRGNLDVAQPLLDSVLRSARARNSVRGQGRALQLLGELHLARGHLPEARALLTEALALAQRAHQRVLELEVLARLADAEATRDARVAMSYLRRHNALRDTIFDQDAALRIAAREARVETDAALRANSALRATQRSQADTISRQRLTVAFVSVILVLVLALFGVLARFNRRERARTEALTRANGDLERLNSELRTALSEVRTLSGLIPICANCKRVRDDRGYWQAVETFVSQHSQAIFSHSICQSCGPQLYGTLWNPQAGSADDRGDGAADAPDRAASQ